jgi:Tol biopolymer transport system component
VISGELTGRPAGRTAGGYGLRAIAMWMALACGGLAAPPLAGATLPGRNGPIVFSSYGEIYRVSPDGSGLAQIQRPFEDEKTDFGPEWSPDGSRIATGGEVLEPESGGSRRWSDTNIHLFAPDGSGFTRLSMEDQHANYSPAWSPDGTRIAYTSDLFGNASIHSVRADGTDARHLTGGTQDAVSSDPAWSPDGALIVFARVVDDFGSTDLFTMRPDGSDVRRLLERPGREGNPSWSPDGNWIAFDGTGPRVVDGVSWSFPGSDVYVVPAAGGVPLKLTDTGEDGAPDWAPDGSAIVFQSARDTPSPQTRLDLYVMDAAGLHERRLTTLGCLQCDPDWGRLPGSNAPASNTGATPAPTGPAAPDSTRGARITRFKIAPRRFRWSMATRVRISFLLSRAGKVRFTMGRIRPGQARPSAWRRQVTRAAQPGLNRYRLKRLFTQRLRPGRFRLTIATVNGASRAHVTFRVRRPA